jgi:hypothetical protein
MLTMHAEPHKRLSDAYRVIMIFHNKNATARLDAKKTNPKVPTKSTEQMQEKVFTKETWV